MKSYNDNPYYNRYSLLSLTMISVLSIPLTACDSGSASIEVTQEKPTDIQFWGISAPVTAEERNQVRTTGLASVDGKVQSIGYTKLMSVGERNHHELFGALKDYTDTAIMVDGKPLVCNGTALTDLASSEGSGPDHTSIIQKNGKLYNITQFECPTGAMYLTELAQSMNGKLTVKPNSMKFISQRSGFGGWIHCAGVTTPWQSHLGSEEYEPNARKVIDAPDSHYGSVTTHFWKGDEGKNNPYYYGWTPEVSVDQHGNPIYVKHFSMGRFSHELAYIMPDQKTVYLTDDGTNVGLFLFIADKASELSSGKLYAAKWTQTTDYTGTDAGEAVLTWVDMGHSTNTMIKAKLDPDNNIATNDGITFSDIFATENPTDGVCPTTGSGLDGRFKSINTSAGHECLSLKDLTGDGQVGVDDIALASRLETRRMAALLGATTEFRKEEGITFNARDNKLYVAMSEIAKGMETAKAKDSHHLGGNDHIQVAKNPCGAVYELSVGKDAIIGSNFVAYNMKGLISGKPLASGVGYSGTGLGASYKTCDVDAIANPDNLTFLEDSNTLVIGEDGEHHAEDFVWAYDIQRHQLTRIASMVSGSAATSPYWYKNINGQSYLTLTVQHPYGEAPYKPEGTVDIPNDVPRRSEIGYLGVFRLR